MTGPEYQAARRALGYRTAAEWRDRINAVAGEHLVDVLAVRAWDQRGPTSTALLALGYEQRLQEQNETIGDLRARVAQLNDLIARNSLLEEVRARYLRRRGA